MAKVNKQTEPVEPVEQNDNDNGEQTEMDFSPLANLSRVGTVDRPNIGRGRRTRLTLLADTTGRHKSTVAGTDDLIRQAENFAGRGGCVKVVPLPLEVLPLSVQEAWAGVYQDAAEREAEAERKRAEKRAEKATAGK